MNRLAKGGLNAFEGREVYPAVVVADLDVGVVYLLLCGAPALCPYACPCAVLLLLLSCAPAATTAV